MKKSKQITALALLLSLALSALCFVGCDAECTVTYVLNNGEENKCVTVSAFSMAPAVDEPKKEGYTFLGWFADEACTTEYGKNALITSDITLYAGWRVDLESLVNSVSEELMSANVRVRACYYDYSFGGYTLTSSSLGSGVIYKGVGKTYYALTNYHVITPQGSTDKTNYFVYDMYGNEYVANYIAGDPDYDLAVLVFESKKTLSEAEIVDRLPNEKELVVAIGQPSGQYNSVTLGHVVDYEKIEVKTSDSDSSDVDFPVIWSTAPTAKGSSGGGLFDSNLKLLGINYATGYTNGESVYTFTIPAFRVLEFLEEHGI